MHVITDYDYFIQPQVYPKTRGKCRLVLFLVSMHLCIAFLGQKVCYVASEQTYTQALVTNYVVQRVSKQLSEIVVPVKYIILRGPGSCLGY